MFQQEIQKIKSKFQLYNVKNREGVDSFNNIYQQVWKDYK